MRQSSHSIHALSHLHLNTDCPRRNVYMTVKGAAEHVQITAAYVWLATDFLQNRKRPSATDLTMGDITWVGQYCGALSMQLDPPGDRSSIVVIFDVYSRH